MRLSSFPTSEFKASVSERVWHYRFHRRYPLHPRGMNSVITLVVVVIPLELPISMVPDLPSTVGIHAGIP